MRRGTKERWFLLRFNKWAGFRGKTIRQNVDTRMPPRHPIGWKEWGYVTTGFVRAKDAALMHVPAVRPRGHIPPAALEASSTRAHTLTRAHARAKHARTHARTHAHTLFIVPLLTLIFYTHQFFHLPLASNRTVFRRLWRNGSTKTWLSSSYSSWIAFIYLVMHACVLAPVLVHCKNK